MRLFAWAIFTVVASGVAVAGEPPVRFPEGKSGKGELIYLQGMPVVIVRGSPAEMGEQFGVLAVKNAPDLDGLQKNFLRDAGIESRFGFLKLMARRLSQGMTDDQRIELAAGSKASGRDPDVALFANSVYDLSSGMGCSTLVVEKGRSKTNEPVFGRNFDWLPSRGMTEHTLLAVFHPTGKHAFATVTVSPIVGCISGMNDAGLACTINEIHLKHSKDRAPFDWEGTPMLLAFRRVLEDCRTVVEAEKLLRAMRRATSACLTICDRDGGAVFEITPRTVVVRKAVNEVCCCTNHFRTDELCLNTKCWRYTMLEPLQNEAAKLGVADVFARLDEVHQGKSTLQSMVFEPARRTLHLKYGTGPATRLEAKVFDLGKMFDQ